MEKPRWLLLTMGIVCALLAGAVLAQQLKPDSQGAARERDRAARVRASSKRFEAEWTPRSPGKVKPALDALLAAWEVEATSRENWAAALEKGVAQDADAARQQVVEAEQAMRRAHDTWQCRRAEHGNILTPEAIESLTKRTPAEAKDELEALIAARKEAESAWAAVADAISAGLPPDQIEETRYLAVSAHDKANLANMARGYAADEANRQMEVDRSGSDELADKLAQLKATNSALLETEHSCIDRHFPSMTASCPYLRQTCPRQSVSHTSPKQSAPSTYQLGVNGIAY